MCWQLDRLPWVSLGWETAESGYWNLDAVFQQRLGTQSRENEISSILKKPQLEVVGLGMGQGRGGAFEGHSSHDPLVSACGRDQCWLIIYEGG